MVNHNYTYAMVEFFGAVIMLVLLIESHFISKSSSKVRILNILLSTLFLLLTSDGASYMLSVSGYMSHSAEIFFLISTSLAFVMLTIFNYYVIIHIREKTGISMWFGHIGLIFAVVESLIWVTSYYLGTLYSITDGVYKRGELFWLSQFMAVGMIAYIFLMIVLFFDVLKKRDRIIFIGCVFGLLLSIVLREIVPDVGIPVVYLIVTLLVIGLYIGIHIEQNVLLRIKDEKLVQSRISIMLSQIRPHFLYNALNVIHYLCEKDPKLAQHAIAEFSDYLRGNLDSVGVDRTVLFSKELGHIKNYLFLEKLRYEDELEIVYELGTINFFLPPLTVQPLVENAVRYGIGQAIDGGKLTIKTVERDEGYEVFVIDDGVGGYDPDNKKEDGRSHVGIENVRERLALMVGGTLEIESEKGKGTKAKIFIPRVHS